MDLFLKTWFWLFDTLPVEAARAGNFFSMLSLLLFRQGILINSSTGEKSQNLEILANWKLVSKKLLKNQSDILNVQLTASEKFLISFHLFEILQLRVKFQTAMVSRSRFIWITNASDRRRVWTKNLLHMK